MSSRARRTESGPPAIELVEEAVHLLRRAPAATLLVYHAGTAPFVVALLWWWARVTWFRPTDAALAWGALGLAGLFAAMKSAQAEFCARLLAQRIGTAPAPWSVRGFVATAADQMRVQAWGILLLPVAAVLTVPFGWVSAYFQTATVLGRSDRLAGEAAAQAKLWPGQNHLGQLFIATLGAAVWLNLAAAFWLLPLLANRLLGIHNLFGFSGWWGLNTTFLASVTGLAWLAVDPLLKAFFTLRVFHGRARRNGDDLRVELAGSRAGGRTAAVLVAAALLATGWPATDARAAEEAGTAATVSVAEAAAMNHAIDQVLARDEYAWRLRPLPTPDTAVADGPVKAFVRSAVEATREFGRWIGRQWQHVRDWVRGFFPDDGETASADGTAGAFAWSALQVVLWSFIVLIAGLLIGVIVVAWRRARGYRRAAQVARPVQVVTPDLRDERTQAAQLPADGWLTLAREQLAAGEWRLALRALHLASLARLAADGWIALATFKTNLDYERELRRRAAARQELIAWFHGRRQGFEAVWYGREPAFELAAREWLAELERPAPA